MQTNGLVQLHSKVDAEAKRLAERHADRLKCGKGCSSCCVDELTVFEVEAERIREAHPSVLLQEPHPVGACAFLDTLGACRVYESRPYVCRTQGLPLRWLEENDQEDIVEQRDICPLNGTRAELEGFSEDDCWLLGPSEERLMDVQESQRGRLRRVSLRSLFDSR